MTGNTICVLDKKITHEIDLHDTLAKHYSNKNLFHNLDAYLNTFTRELIQGKSLGYVQKEQSPQQNNKKSKVHLNLGINPYGCAAEVLEYKQMLNLSFLNHYLEDDLTDLRLQIAQRHMVTADSVVLSSGLDHMLQLITATFLNPQENVLTLSPSFFLFDEYSRLRGAKVISLELKESDQFDWTAETTAQYLRFLKKYTPKLFFLANPNNPTGRVISLQQLEPIIKAARMTNTIVVLDEAYGEFTDNLEEVVSATEFSKKYYNLIVLRTLSKGLGLADLRVGYAVVQPSWVKALNTHRTFFPFTHEVYALAKFALQPKIITSSLYKTKDFLDKTRRMIYAQLAKLPAIKFIPTQSNIFMLKHVLYSAVDLMKKLDELGIVVANVSGKDEIAKAYIRVTIGKPEEMQLFLDVLREMS